MRRGLRTGVLSTVRSVGRLELRSFGWNRRTAVAPRRGVASLELCLALPLLLFVMALFINAGSSAAWKVRAHGVARDAVWRHRWPRSDVKPKPAAWPAGATSSSVSTGSLTIVDDPAVDLPVVRGPTIGNIDVDQELLDPTLGGLRGKATIDRERPLLTSLGNMQYDLDHPLVDRTWTYPQTKLSSNWLRRIKVIYDMHESEMGEWSGFEQAVSAVESALQSTNLLPLTYRLTAWDGDQWFEDPDFQRLHYVADGITFTPKSPDFHPKLGNFCSLDAEAVFQKQVAALIVKIKGDQDKNVKGVPQVMATKYIQLFKGAINAVQMHLNQLQSQDPPAPPGLIGAVQAELDARKSELEPKIAELEAFLATF